VVRQINIEDAFDRIDFNHILERIDLNHVLDRVDINRQLDRVDMNAFLAKVDIDALIERSKIDQIIAKSTTGACTACIDMIRNNLVLGDQWIQRFGRLACLSKEPWLPPRPGARNSWKTPWPKGAKKFGFAVQGRFAGTMARGLAWLLDSCVLGSVFLGFTLLGGLIGEKVTGNPTWTIDNDWIIPLLYFFYWTTYNMLCLSCSGRTLGMGVFGLLVVDAKGHRPRYCQIVLRTYIMPFNIAFFGWVISLIRRDAKTYNDFLSCTCVVYSWDAKLALLRGGGSVRSISAVYLNEDEEEMFIDPQDESFKDVKDPADAEKEK
jgi:uncharacterized RDD family membrane protein YckC